MSFDVDAAFAIERPHGGNVMITLGPADVALAYDIATRWGKIKLPGQSDRSRLSSDPQITVDLAGAAGRVAFIVCYLGLPYDARASRSGDPGYHVRFDGHTLDVKTTRMTQGHLALSGPKPGMNLRTDFVGLAEVPKKNWDGRTVKLVGWTTEKRARSLMKKRDIGQGPRETVLQTQLLHLPALRAYVRGEVVPRQEVML